MTPSEFKAAFLAQVARLASDGDVYPQPFVVLHDDGQIVSCALALDGVEILNYVARYIRRQKVTALAYGFDRFTKPDQGTTRASVFTWTVVWETQATHGVLEHEGDLVDPPREDCEFWNRDMARLWAIVRPDPARGAPTFHHKHPLAPT